MKLLVLIVAFLLVLPGFGQPDLQRMELEVTPDFARRSIQVNCRQHWKTESSVRELNLLLFPQYTIHSVKRNNDALAWKRTGTGLIISIPAGDTLTEVEINYSGVPIEAMKPPWENGFVWRTDKNNLPWLGVVCEHEGAQLWWPAPSNYSDKIEQVKLAAIYPSTLYFKGNGQFVDDEILAHGLRKTTWQVSYPITPYNITLNIGDYRQLHDTLQRPDGSVLELNYYPLSYNSEKALTQLGQVKPMLRCYEAAFGIYPFQRDGYSLVEASYAGMEHQGAVAYGNGWADGYLGSDYSGVSIWFDFILIHETGHEWWGNSVTGKAKKDFWLQEAFCTYAEWVYVKCRFGDDAAKLYINAKKRLTQNTAPILGTKPSGVDMYAKGALMLHTLSNFAVDESAWGKLINEFAMTFKYKTVTTEEFAEWFSKRLPNVTPVFFSQYLEKAAIPELELRISGAEPNRRIRFRISNGLKGVKIPFYFRNSERKLIATPEWQSLSVNEEVPEPDTLRSYFTVKKSF